MPASIRPYVTAGVALVGASVISVTPIQPLPPQIRVANVSYNLTAATLPGGAIDGTGDGVACSGYHTDQCDIWAGQSYTPIVVDTNHLAWKNVPANILNAIISVPRAYLDALDDVSYSMEVTGSWWVYTPTNVLGYDPADPPKITAVTNMLIPFQALSNPLGEHVSWWAKANLPMNAGCTGTAPPTCKDANAILSHMFTAPIWDLIAGYTFPALNDPVSDAEGAAGEEIPDSEGQPVPWSATHIQINPYDPIWNVINYMVADPEQNRPEKFTLAEVGQSLVRFAKAVWVDFYPFVPGSFLFKGYPYTLVTPFIKPFVKILCPKCDTEHPEDPTPFDGELPPSSQDVLDNSTPGVTSQLGKLRVKDEVTSEEVTTTAETTATEEATTEEATTEESTAEAPAKKNGAVVKTAVTNLLPKFTLAPDERRAARDDTEVETDSGSPAGTEAVGTTQDETISDDDTKPSDDGAGTHKKKWTIGARHHGSVDTEKTSDKRSATASESKKSESESESAKSSVGSNAGAGNNGGGSDSGGDE